VALEIWWSPLVWGAPFIGSMLSGLAGIYSRKASALVGSGSIAISAILSLILISIYISSGDIISSPRYSWIEIPLGGRTISIDLGVYLDGISMILTLMVAWISLLIGIYSINYMRGDPGEHRYWVFFTFFVGSMLLLVMADNLVLLIIGWEGTSLASYGLIGHWYRDEEHAWVGDPGRTALGRPMWFTPSHAGVRAIIMTGVPDIGFILGATAIIIYGGTAYIPDLYEKLSPLMGELASRGILAGFLLLFTLGALAKSAQFPLHEWLVTAMTGPASVSALIHAATMVKAGVYFMLRFVPIFIASAGVAGDMAISQVRDYLAVVGGIGVFTAFMMATMALVARELKLILAFSTASQIGYMFMAASYSGLLREPGLGIIGGISHLLSHAVFKASLFLGAGFLIHGVGSRYIDGMMGRAGVYRITIVSMILAAMGLAAIPPLSGFWSKDLAVDTAVEAGILPSAILALITSLITAVYATRMISILYLTQDRGRGYDAEEHGEDPVQYIPYLLLAIATPAIGVFWALYMDRFSHIALRGIPVGEVEVKYSPLLAITSALIASLGFALTVVIYWRYRGSFQSISRNPLLATIARFLYDRWFFNSLLYIVFVDGGRLLVRAVGRFVEDLFIDGLYHRRIPGVFGYLSRILRSYQPGVINSYLVIMLIGVAILIALQVVR